MKSIVGPGTFAAVQELLWYNYSSVVGCLLSGSMVGLTCCASQVCCSQSFSPLSRPLLPVPTQKTLKHSEAGVAQSLGFLGPGAHTDLFEPSELSGGYGGLILNVIFPFLPTWGFSFALGHGVSFFFFWWDLTMVVH